MRFPTECSAGVALKVLPLVLLLCLVSTISVYLATRGYSENRVREKVCQSGICPDALSATTARPVCGSDGRTYGNECALLHAGCSPGPAGRVQLLHRVHYGECTKEEQMIGRITGWKPDGAVSTYSTQPTPFAATTSEPPTMSSSRTATVFITAPATVVASTQETLDQSTNAYESHPSSEAPPTTTDRSVEATSQLVETSSAAPSDQSTTATEASAAEPSPTATSVDVFDWSCPAEGQCLSIPARPICGSDGETYLNLCLLRDFACKTGDTSLTPVGSGNCTGKPETAECFPCGDFYDPVCGTDKQSYLNVCHLRQEACKRRDAKLKVSFDGLCEIPVRVCSVSRPCNPFSGTAVCGTDGTTYPSLCYLRRTACKRRNFGLVEAYHGECMTGRLSNVCQERCPDIESAVCGTDGLTYRNYCFLQRAVCREPGLCHAYDGRCNRVNQVPQDISALIP